MHQFLHMCLKIKTWYQFKSVWFPMLNETFSEIFKHLADDAIEIVQEPNDFFMLQFFTKEHIYVGVDAFQFPWKAPLEMLGKAEKQ